MDFLFLWAFEILRSTVGITFFWKEPVSGTDNFSRTKILRRIFRLEFFAFFNFFPNDFSPSAKFFSKKFCLKMLGTGILKSNFFKSHGGTTEIFLLTSGFIIHKDFFRKGGRKEGRKREGRR